ncbi:TolB family protein [Fulvivirga sedimenti]|uniref:Uncharacterized protein n=1 Tax=Fulvivirga sedimenti TaxID=2879465 RepID=A0A9X1KX05_9BACT|nr:hypothetical protein [Fulvivirga sedimenti]MCA6073772.1 hypothetical protein [Fulvivirga sedimenti]
MNLVKIAVFLPFLLFAGCGPAETSNDLVYADKVIRQPEPFAPGIISTEGNSEFSIMFSADGLKAWFARRAPEQKQKIYVTEFVNGAWKEPVIEEFSTDRDEAPSITPDDQLFFFGSERPIPGKPNLGNFDMNIWMMVKTAEGWSDPEPLPFPINDVQEEGEEWPSSNNNFFFALDNETFLYTTMVRGTSAVKLYQVSYRNGLFSEPVEITGLFDDEKYWVYSAVVSPDGKYLVFNSYGAPGGAGGEDLWVSRRNGEGWSKARPISVVNSENEESGPRFSRDGKYFFFNRAENLGNYEYREWDIYFIETRYLNLEQIFSN